jgi:acyl-CoA synthetase (AMP-forming)/AMP-acid ligase II
MGDVGYLDDQGRLWFCGRKSHRVETAYGTLFTDMVEPIFNTVPGVFRTALVGVARGGVTYPVVWVELDSEGTRHHVERLDLRGKSGNEGGRIIFEAIESSLRQTAQKFAHTKAITTFLFQGPLPVDTRHNAKIFREKLAVWADKRLGTDWKPESPR